MANRIMPLRELINSLDEHDKKYVVKTVMVNADNEMKMVVPASTHNVDLSSLQDALRFDEVTLPTEEEFQDRFPDCELGGMRPSGNIDLLKIYTYNFTRSCIKTKSDSLNFEGEVKVRMF